MMAPANALQWVSATLQLAALKARMVIDRGRQYCIVVRGMDAYSSGLLLYILRSADLQYYNVDVIGDTEFMPARVDEHGWLPN